jgi:hypothetical protein
VLSANAGAAGNGGTVAVWSNSATSFAGLIDARGGSSSGNGGSPIPDLPTRAPRRAPRARCCSTPTTSRFPPGRPTTSPRRARRPTRHQGRARFSTRQRSTLRWRRRM